MRAVRPSPGRPRRGPLERLVLGALTIVLASVLVVTTAGLLAVVLWAPEGASRPEVPDAQRATVAPDPGTPAEIRGMGVVGEAAAPVPPPVAVDDTAVLAAVDAAAGAADGTVAVAVLDAFGRPLVTGPAAGDALLSASVVKLHVVGRLLALGAAGALDLGEDDLALMERAIVTSDDGAMSTLWDRYDGAALVTATAADAGLTATAPPRVAGQWGEARLSAADVAALLAGLADTLGEGPAATLLGWMRETAPTAADGFSQTFGLLAGGPGIAAKQGWMCCVDGRRQLHSAGVLPSGTAVVLLGDFPAATSWGRARAALDSAAAAVLAALG
ncbi:serine hydrolase [Geodermatophilus arenarius]|uniref:Serine hydrolase n=1 Tax=Geodermatophilus arenarius TaxID=1137990 RepID=A0ABV9LH21_9ACTN